MLVDWNQAQLEFLETCSMGDTLKVKQMLVTGRVEPNFQHKINGWTALHWAARRGHEEVCLALLNSGFSREAEAHDGKVPYDVLLPGHSVLREILLPEGRASPSHTPKREGTPKREVVDKSVNVEIEPAEMQAQNEKEYDSRRRSDVFVPNYISNPPFPYTNKSQSFDLAVGPGSPKSSTKDSGYFSYGRRDSSNRTRFLLLRTSCANGKEAYKRITLPGGSSVDQLKRTVERAMKEGKCEAIMTLPDRVLVEDDEQIQLFGDCQKIDAIFNDHDKFPTVHRIVRPSSIPSPIKGQSPVPVSTRSTGKMEHDPGQVHVEENSSLLSSLDVSLVEIPHSHEDEMTANVTFPLVNGGSSPNEEESVQKEEEMHIASPEFEQNMGPSAPLLPEPEREEEEEEEVAQPVLFKPAFTSVDSDNGDHEYVKVTAEDTKEQDRDIALEKIPASEPTPIHPSKSQEASSEDSPPSSDKQELTAPSTAKVVEENKVTPGQSQSGLVAFVEHNPDLVRACAILSVVAAVTSIGFFIYKKYK